MAKAVFAAPFEMDLTKIAFELTPAGHGSVRVAFLGMSREDSLWGVVIIGYFMINMITSDFVDIKLLSHTCLT